MTFQFVFSLNYIIFGVLLSFMNHDPCILQYACVTSSSCVGMFSIEYIHFSCLDLALTVLDMVVNFLMNVGYGLQFLLP